MKKIKIIWSNKKKKKKSLALKKVSKNLNFIIKCLLIICCCYCCLKLKNNTDLMAWWQAHYITWQFHRLSYFMLFVPIICWFLSELTCEHIHKIVDFFFFIIVCHIIYICCCVLFSLFVSLSNINSLNSLFKSLFKAKQIGTFF